MEGSTWVWGGGAVGSGKTTVDPLHSTTKARATHKNTTSAPGRGERGAGERGMHLPMMILRGKSAAATMLARVASMSLMTPARRMRGVGRQTGKQGSGVHPPTPPPSPQPIPLSHPHPPPSHAHPHSPYSTRERAHVHTHTQPLRRPRGGGYKTRAQQASDQQGARGGGGGRHFHEEPGGMEVRGVDVRLGVQRTMTTAHRSQGPAPHRL